MKLIFLILIFAGLGEFIKAQELSFNNLDSLLAFAEKNSTVIKINNQQLILSRYEKLAALANGLNLHNQLAFSFTDNYQLPISYIPSEILGGTAGTYTEITLGQQYASNINLTTPIDIINPAAWAKIKSAAIGQELTNHNNLLNKKSLFESIAACFYNIVSLQEQIEWTRQIVQSADTLLMIVKNKYSLGLIRQQEVNDAVANKLSVEDKLKQIQAALEQQYNSLKILADIPCSVNLSITGKLNYIQSFDADLNINAGFQYKSSWLETEQAKAGLNYYRLSRLPVVSLFYSYSHYQNSNALFFKENANKSRWQNASYVGIKITFSFPDLNRMVLTNKSKVNYTISNIDLEHSKNQDDISNRQLLLDYETAYSRFTTTQQISMLKEQNYKMALDQYTQSIIPFDKLLIDFNEMLTSRLNCSSALAGLLYSQKVIDLNNSIIK